MKKGNVSIDRRIDERMAEMADLFRSGELVDAFAGLEPLAAGALAANAGFSTVRTIDVDDEAQTMADLRPGRLNLVALDGRVVRAYVER